MTLTYYFDRYENEFEYDLELYDIQEYVENQIPKEEQIKLAEDIYSKLDDASKAAIIADFEDDPECIKNGNLNMKEVYEIDDSYVKEFIYDNLPDSLEDYESDMEDYFREDAYDLYTDAYRNELERDYRSSRGV